MKKQGFTLAEVLITLGIIGVVAALTIPALQNNINDAQIKSQFKKTYSTLSNAIVQMKADLGTYPTCYYTTAGTYVAANMVECSTFWPELKKYLNVAKTCNSNAYANGCIPQYQTGMTGGACGGYSQSNILNTNAAMVLTDGTILLQYSADLPVILVDLNGQKPPNKSGYDMFSFLYGGSKDALKAIPGPCIDSATNGKTTAQMLLDVFD